MERNNMPGSGAGTGSSASGGTSGRGDTGGSKGSQGYGATTGGTAGSMGTSSTSSSTGSSGGSSSGSGSLGGGGIADKARDAAGTAQGKLADVGSTVREKAGSAKDSLADALESGADKLRQKSQGGQYAGATGDGSLSIGGTDLTPAAEKLAGGMQATAGWLREADLDSLKTGVEGQVKEHPGRTLLIAVGVGYLLGKAFRK